MLLSLCYIVRRGVLLLTTLRCRSKNFKEHHLAGHIASVASTLSGETVDVSTSNRSPADAS